MVQDMISVIVPVYNTEAFLDECIQSIVDQTYQNLEIILVDDGSSDRSLQICEDWARKDSRIRAIHKKNGGASAARNTGLDISQGKYIGFVDSDDYIASDMYEVLMAAISSGEKGIADCGVCYVFEDGNIVEQNKRDYRELHVQQSLDAIFSMRIDTGIWCKIFERSVFEDLRFPEGETNEEFPLIVPSIIKAKGVIQVAESKYFYRQRQGSVTSAKVPDTKVLYKNLRLMETQLKKHGIRSRYFRWFSAHFSYMKSLKLEKMFDILHKEQKSDYRCYRNIMWKNAFTYLCAPNGKMKDKILYVLILTKLLRPLYRMFYREHL